MSMEQMLGYLAALEQNNDRGWFHSHRREYEQARAGFESLVDGLLPLLRRFAAHPARAGADLQADAGHPFQP